ncbi:hypothetical protein DQE80_17530, partial [Enterococcus sp. HPCN18]
MEWLSGTSTMGRPRLRIGSWRALLEATAAARMQRVRSFSQTRGLAAAAGASAGGAVSKVFRAAKVAS